MINQYYQKHQEQLRKKDTNITLKKRKIKGEKRSEINTKISPKKKKTKTTRVYEKILLST